MRCAVLGDPIDHSLSPVIHRAAYASLGLDGWQYDAVQVPSGGLADFLGGLDAGEWRGLSLTMPLKREAVPLLDTQDDWVRLAAVCNTVVLDEDGRRHGLNTDVTGALMLLGEHDDLPVERVVVLGGGATAASVLLALAERGTTHATLVVRDPARAGETVRVGLGHPRGLAIEVRSVDEVSASQLDADVLVSTVPASAQVPRAAGRGRRDPTRVRGRLRALAHPARGGGAAIGPHGPQRARPPGGAGGQPGRGDDRTLRRPGRRDAPRRRGRPGVEADPVTDLYPVTAAVTAVLGLASGPLVPRLIALVPEPEPDPEPLDAAPPANDGRVTDRR